MTISQVVIKCLSEIIENDISMICADNDNVVLKHIGLTSINAVYFILRLEEEFGIRFEAEELVAENIGTLPKICKMIENKMIAN